MVVAECRLAPEGRHVKEGYEMLKEVTDEVMSSAPLKLTGEEMESLSQSQVLGNKSRPSRVGTQAPGYLSRQ